MDSKDVACWIDGVVDDVSTGLAFMSINANGGIDGQHGGYPWFVDALDVDIIGIVVFQ